MKNIELLKKLCTAVGVSGEEDAVLCLKEQGISSVTISF